VNLRTIIVCIEGIHELSNVGYIKFVNDVYGRLCGLRQYDIRQSVSRKPVSTFIDTIGITPS